MEKNIFLPFYEKCMQDGKMRWAGLCGNFDGLDSPNGIEAIYTITPTDSDFETLRNEDMNWGFWGSGLKGESDDEDVQYAFTELRQTLTLFMAALNEEFYFDEPLIDETTIILPA